MKRLYSSDWLSLSIFCLYHHQSFIFGFTENEDATVQKKKKVFLKHTHKNNTRTISFVSKGKTFARQKFRQFSCVNKMPHESVKSFYFFFLLHRMVWTVKIWHPHFHSFRFIFLRFPSIPHAVFFQHPYRERMPCVWEGRLALTESVSVWQWLMRASVQKQTFGRGLAQETKKQKYTREGWGVRVCVNG